MFKNILGCINCFIELFIFKIINYYLFTNTGISISTIPNGSLQNMPFVATNEEQLAWMQPPFISAGLNSEGPLE